ARTTSIEVDRFKREEIGTEEMFFWQKSLARAFFAFADVLGSVLCRAIIERAAELGLKLSRTKQKELARSRSATMKRLSLGFSLFPLLFESDFRIELSAIEMRALEV